MKVTRTTDVSTAGATEAGKRTAKPEEEFGRVLEEQLNQITPASGQAAQMAASISTLESVASIPYGMEQPQVADSTNVARSIESTIDRLDEVEQLLGDSTVTPKTVGQVIDQLNDQTEALRHTMEALPEDHPLQELGNEVTVLATVESIKWDRGDYL
jgi:DNA repair ATPase RecN